MKNSHKNFASFLTIIFVAAILLLATSTFAIQQAQLASAHDKKNTKDHRNHNNVNAQDNINNDNNVNAQDNINNDNNNNDNNDNNVNIPGPQPEPTPSTPAPIVPNPPPT